MATVRLIGKTNKVYELDTSEHTMLIYLSAGEKTMVSNMQDGEVLVMGPKHTSQSIFDKQKKKLISETKPHYIE